MRPTLKLQARSLPRAEGMLPSQEDRQQQPAYSGASSSGKPAAEGVWRPKRVEEAQSQSTSYSQQTQQSRFSNISDNRRQQGRSHTDGPIGGESQSSFSAGLGPEQRRDFSGISRERDGDHLSGGNFGTSSNVGVVGPTREFPRPDLLPVGGSREFPRPSDNSTPGSHLLPSDSTRDFGGFAASLGPPGGRMGAADGPSSNFAEDPDNRFVRAAKEAKQQVLPISETRDVGQWGPSDFGGSSGGYGGDQGFGNSSSGGRFGNESGLGGGPGQNGPYGGGGGPIGMAQPQLQRGWNVGPSNGPFGGPGGGPSGGGGEGGFGGGGGHSFGGGSYGMGGGRGEGRQSGDSRGGGGGGGGYGDSRGNSTVFGGMRRPGEDRSERVNPMGKSKEISVQTRYQQNLIDLIAKPEKDSAAASQDGRPRLALTRGGAPIDSGNSSSAVGNSHQSTGPSGSASGTSVVGQGRSGSQADQEQSSAANLAVKAAAMFGDDIALATLKTNLVRVIDDFMAAFGKDAPKRSAKELAGLAGGDKNKLRYSIYILADHAFKFDAPGERQQLAGLAVALLAGTKKEPAAATHEDIAEGLEQALELSDKTDSSRQRFFTFLEELVRSKGGLPEGKLGPLSRAVFAEKPAQVVEVTEESESAEAEAAATKTPQVVAPVVARLTQDEMYAALEDVKLVAARVISSGLIGSEIVSIARDAFTKYSKADAASALVDEILKVSFFSVSLGTY